MVDMNAAERRRRNLAEHHATWIMLTGVAITVPAYWPHSGFGVLGALALILVVGVAGPLIMMGALLDLAHGRKLCELCVTDWPVNAAEVASTYVRRLRFHHNMWSLIVGVTIVVSAGVWLPTDSWWPLAVICGWVAFFGYRYLCEVTHRRVQPWCPICGDQDDDDTYEEVPDPVDAGRA